MGLNEEKRDRLDRIWRDETSPHTACGIEELYNAVRRETRAISLNDVKEYLSGKRSYTIHKGAIKRFPRRRVLVAGPGIIVGADLADVSNLAKENSGVRYLLVCLDIFSRFMTIIPLKDKRGTTCATALRTVLDEDGYQRVRRLWTDKGKEFTNTNVNRLLRDKGIRLYHTEGHEIKVSIVERAIRTIKGRLYRWMTEHGTLTYLPALSQLVNNYNNRPHRGLQQATPNNVHRGRSPTHTRQQFNKLHAEWYKRQLRHSKRASLAVGDNVRITLESRGFDKGYLYQNTEEIFTITAIDKQQPIWGYRLADLDGEDIKGIFYQQELVKAKLPLTFAVDVIGERRRGKKREVLVHYRGYNSRHDRWLPAGDVVTSGGEG